MPWVKIIKESAKSMKCDLCKRERNNGYKDHYEEHIKPPRTLNICKSCHCSLHKSPYAYKPPLDDLHKMLIKQGAVQTKKLEDGTSYYHWHNPEVR